MFECVVQLNYALLNFIIGLITNDVLIIKLKAVEVRMMSAGNIYGYRSESVLCFCRMCRKRIRST